MCRRKTAQLSTIAEYLSSSCTSSTLLQSESPVLLSLLKIWVDVSSCVDLVIKIILESLFFFCWHWLVKMTLPWETKIWGLHSVLCRSTELNLKAVFSYRLLLLAHQRDYVKFWCKPESGINSKHVRLDQESCAPEGHGWRAAEPDCVLWKLYGSLPVLTCWLESVDSMVKIRQQTKALLSSGSQTRDPEACFWLST